MFVKYIASALMLVVVAQCLPQYYYEELPEDLANHRQYRMYEYAAVHPGNVGYAGGYASAAGGASSGLFPALYAAYPYSGGGSAAAASAVASSGGRYQGLAPYQRQSAGSAAVAQSSGHGYRDHSAAAATAAAAGIYY